MQAAIHEQGFAAASRNPPCVTQRMFVAAAQPRWNRLEGLLERAHRGGSQRLGADDIFELGRLYRQVTSDLAYAQGRAYDANVQRYLNRLTARAHAQVYGAAATTGRGRITRFFLSGFPGECCRSWPFIAACVVLTVVWAGAGYALASRDPINAYALLPEWMVPAHITQSLHDSNFNFSANAAAAVSSGIIGNNVRVAILAFAAGIITAGAFTIYVISLNGLMLGVLGALYAHAGFGLDFWATVAPHGFIELTAIQIAGGAGLLMAASVLFPGRLIRREALRIAAQRAGTLVGGVLAMLCVAGAIEGFFSPRHLQPWTRIDFGIVTAVLMAMYFGAAGVRFRRAP